MQRRTVRPPIIALLVIAGTLVAAGALEGYTKGPPRNDALEILVLVGVATLPASAIVVVPAACLGIALLFIRATRQSGVALTAYAGAYVAGLLLGAALFAALQSASITAS